MTVLPPVPTPTVGKGTVQEIPGHVASTTQNHVRISEDMQNVSRVPLAAVL